MLQQPHAFDARGQLDNNTGTVTMASKKQLLPLGYELLGGAGPSRFLSRLRMNHTNLPRRRFAFLVAGTGLGLLGCQRPYEDPSANPLGQQVEPMTPEQEKIMAARARMLTKFQELDGVGWQFGAKAGHEFLGVTFFREIDTERVFFQSSSLWRKNRIQRSGRNSAGPIAGVPEKVRVVWREDDSSLNDRYVGKIDPVPGFRTVLLQREPA